VILKKVRNLFFAVIIICTLSVGTFQPVTFAAEEVTEEGTITIVGNGENILEETSYIYEEDTTAFDVLVNSVGAENVEYVDYPSGKMISGINGLTPAEDETFYWAFYINGVSAQVGADSYEVQNGDKISFRYVDWTNLTDSSVSLKVIGNEENDMILNPSTISFIDQPTAFDLLKVVLGPEKMTYTTFDFGAMIDSIDGLKAEGTYYWAFYINGEQAQKGVSDYQLQNGDEISLQYESWETPEEEPKEEEVEQPEDPSSAKPFDEATLTNSIIDATEYVLQNEFGDWQAIAIKQAGKTLPANYFENLKKQIKDKEGSFSKITDYERLTLGVLAAGGNPTNIEGYNLVEKIYNGNVTKQGLNGVANALIALDSAEFDIPENANWSREELVGYLMENQNEDGGWSWSGDSTSDSDTTAMVITALAPYKTESDVKAAIDLAASYLSNQFQTNKIDNSSTAAQIIIGLSALAIDANSEAFTNNEGSLIDYLLTFQNVDGGFDWQGGDTSDVFSTDQAYRGIVAYQLFLNGEGSLYSLPLVDNGSTPAPPVTPAEDDKSDEVKVDTDKKDNNTTQEEEQADTVNNSNSDNKINTETNKEQQSTTTVTHRLPNTATSHFNLLAAGGILVIIGLIVFVYQKRRNMNKA
jgi:LPXTG-motif cell wall-anchored protein